MRSRRILVAGLAALGLLSGGSTPALATHQQCNQVSSEFEPGVGGYWAGIDTAPNWYGICLRIDNGLGSPIAYHQLFVLVKGGGSVGEGVAVVYCASLDLYCTDTQQVGVDLTPAQCPEPVGTDSNCRGVILYQGPAPTDDAGVVGYDLNVVNPVPVVGDFDLIINGPGVWWHPADLTIYLGDDLPNVVVSLCISATYPVNHCPDELVSLE